MKKSRIVLIISFVLIGIFITGGFVASQIEGTPTEDQRTECELDPAESGTHYEMPQVVPTAWLRGR
ncbi:MAG TPA: hypothetical protein VJ911_02265 [Cryomorphaceae bacterium]|nr:hypothetical protein [Cryomorphaceae bacterium]